MTSLTPPTGHNSGEVSPELFLDFTREARLAKRACDEANSAYRHVLKRAEKAGINLKQFRRALADAGMDPDVKAQDDKIHASYMAWLGKPLGFQGTLDIVEPTQRAKDALANEVWEQEGYDAALAGRGPDDCPYEAGSIAASFWRTGNSEGNAFKNKVPALAKKEPKPRKPRKGKVTAETETTH